MHRLPIGMALAALMLSTASAGAVELDQIERAVVKEPNYRGQPSYCLLVFGPEAKTRIWLAFDDDTVYVDQQRKGDLTAKALKLADNKATIDLGVVPDGNGQSKEAKMHLQRVPPSGARMFYSLGGKTSQSVGIAGEMPVTFADKAKDAPIIHLGGPLTYRLESSLSNLKPGKDYSFSGRLGTPGLGPGSFATLHPIFVTEGRYHVRMAFPHQDPDRPRIEKEFLLSQGSGCSRVLFVGTMKVPEEAGGGSVRLSVPADGWKPRSTAE